jgi:hypothetical protein
MVASVKMKTGLPEKEGMEPFLVTCRSHSQSLHLIASEHRRRDLGSGDSWQCRGRYVLAST